MRVSSANLSFAFSYELFSVVYRDYEHSAKQAAYIKLCEYSVKCVPAMSVLLLISFNFVLKF